MSWFEELPLAAQTAYAELAEATRAYELHRSVGQLHGSFAQKTVKGRRYWYFQYRDISGAVRQLYVGPDSEEVSALVARAKQAKPDGPERLARSAIALGCEPVLARHFRIIRRLSEHGFFRVGGVLVGTHAFLALGNVLGVKWKESSRTQDVDFAHAGKSIAIALPANATIDTHKTIESLEMGFLPLTSFAGKSEATYVSSSDPSLRVDFLTTMHRGDDEPIVLPNLNVALQPLEFMELILEHPIQAAVFADEGSVLVNIPAPTRYALHKLIVWGERNTGHRAKATKDLHQAVALLAYHATHRPTELRDEWRDLLDRGPGWRKRASTGLRAAAKLAPDLNLAALLESKGEAARGRVRRKR